MVLKELKRGDTIIDLRKIWMIFGKGGGVGDVWCCDCRKSGGVGDVCCCDCRKSGGVGGCVVL